MDVYRVGGSVRDELMGLPPGDRDWVVVGATPEDMVAGGYIPVGRDFPVFLHPVTHEEYALARTERKTAPGYRGFVFHADASVTLEQDLRRRDLTINAIARAEDGTLTDPYGGRADIAARLLRHVSDAFVEDPVRILRVARFAARFHDFTVASETMGLMRDMVEAGEADALVAERVWQELSRGLMEARPSRMIEVLRASGALRAVLPEVDRLFGVPQPPQHHPEIDTGLHLLQCLDWAAAHGASLATRWALVAHDLGKGTTPQHEWPRHIAHEVRSAKLARELAERLRVPVDIADIARLVAQEHTHVHRAAELRADTMVKLLERLDVMRKPGRLADILLACEADARSRPGRDEAGYPQAAIVQAAVEAIRSVDAGAIAGEMASAGKAGGAAIAQAVHAARVRAVAAL
ncbi:multifunctional CCA addition/repair protein [Methyloversatilis thermotolerans]|uniref:multifunctional CCA addition/repair protein n=1 Tax=Methyloversatilis thermotolerans TaxID=1346290 RepID=UPI00037B6E43|nr:multifunctional CCA addition/repair protein [Methyloversatilis thermotolerans]